MFQKLALALGIGLLATIAGAAPKSPAKPTPKPASASKDEIAAIRAAGVLRVATTAEDSPPFIYRDANGKRAGVDAEIAQAMAEKLGVRLEWVTGPRVSFKEVFDSLERGKADVALAALYPTLERVSAARFTEPYFRVKQILFVQRVRATSLKLPADFEGIVARPNLVYGYFPDAGTTDGFLRRELRAKWVAYDRVPGTEPRGKMIEDFVGGGLTAVWIDEIELEKWRHLKKNIDLYGFAVEVPRSELPIAMAVRRDRPVLLEWANLFLAQAGRGDALRRLYRRERGTP